MNLKSFIIASICTLSLLLLFLFYYDHTLDDSFITYRYAKNLAEGHGLTWNINENPVEGYTSFLWVLLNAVGIACKMDPVIFSKVISSISIIAIIWVLAIASKNMHWSLATIFIGSIAFSPLFAFLTMFGMETTLTALLILITASLSLRILEQPSAKTIFFWYIFSFIAALSRPDTLPITGGIFLGLVFILVFQKNYITLKLLLLHSLAFIALGSLYMIWRFQYFGYLFPNTFYIKTNPDAGLFITEGRNYVEFFIKKYMLLYIPLIAFLFGRHPINKVRLLKLTPILAGCSFFGIYLFTIIPIQGQMWRFIFPAFPIFLLSLLYYFQDVNPTIPGIKKEILYLLPVFLFAGWTLRFIPDTLYMKDLTTPYDRIAVGKKLSDLNGTMFISESGALPFFSNWKAVDLLGLNSEEIAHRGLSIEYLNTLNPDLVMLLSIDTTYDPQTPKFRLINKYMTENGFIAAAVIQKNFQHYHYYFVRENSPLFDKIIDRIINIEGVKYGDLEKLMLEKRIPIQKVW